MEKKTTGIPYLIQWLQLGVLIIGVAGFFSDIGRKSAILDKTTTELSEIKSIIQALVQSQITSAVNDALHQEILDSLKIRVSELERKTIRAN